MPLIGVREIQAIIYPPVHGFLSPLQATNIVLRLIITSIEPIDVHALKLLSRFFTPQDYDDLVEERTIISRCGYPTCANTLRDTGGNIRNPTKKTVLPWQHSFCQLRCYQASQFYREQLKDEALITRTNVTCVPPGEMFYEQEIMLLPEVLEIANQRNQTVSETVVELIKNHRKLVDQLENLEL